MAQDNPDLFVLGLAGAETDTTLNAFLEQTGVTFPIAWDDGTFRDQIDFPPALSPYPRQVLIDREGVIRYTAAEYNASELTLAIERAMAE